MDERFPGSAEPEAPPPYLGGGAAAGAGQMSDRMQSMLARAAEEQMAEQRQLQVLVNDVRSSLAQLQQDVKLNAAATTVEVLRGEVSALGAETRTSGTQLGERLEAVVRAITASVQAVQSVGAQLEGITGQLTDQHGTLAGLPSTVQRAVSDAIPPADTAVPAEVAALRAELTALRAEVAQLRASTADVVRGELAQLRDETRATTASLSQTLTEHRDATRLEVQSARNAVEDSSRRLSSHVDEAVLALAEAMLRRRPTSGAQAAPTAPAAAAAPVVPAVAPAVEAGEPEEVAADDTTAALDNPVIAEDAPRVSVTSAAAPRLAPAPSPVSPVVEPVAVEPDEAQAEVTGDDLAHAEVDEVDDFDVGADAESVGETDEPDDLAAEVGLVEDEIEDSEPETARAPLSAWALTEDDEPAGDDDAELDVETAADADLAADEVGEHDDEPEAAIAPPPPPPPPPAPSADDDEESPVGWFGAEDRPQSAFTLQDGWDRAARKERAPDAPDDEADGESADRERRRPWWRPGG